MECMLPEFDLFQPSTTQNQITGSSYQDFTPITALQHQSPIEFAIPGAPNTYYDLSASYLYVKCKITKADGTAPAANADVGPINNVGDSLFSQIDVELNGKPFSEIKGYNHYIAYIENLLSFSKEVQENQLLSSSLFARDTPGKWTDFRRIAAGENTGLKERGGYFDSGNEVDLVIRPHVEPFNQPRSLLQNIPIRIKLYPNKDAFVLMTPAGTQQAPQENYRMVIVEARMYIKCLHVSGSLVLAHEKILQTTNAKYPYKNVEMKHISIPIGQTHAPFENIFMGQLPDLLILGMVSDAAMAGGYQQNPFYFQHFGLNYLALYVNGEMVPSRPYQPNFAKGLVLPELNSLYQALGVQFTDKSVPLNRKEYINGYTLFAFDLSTDKNASRCLSPLRTGTIRVEVKFSAPTTETINLLVYARFDGRFEVDKYKNVLMIKG